MNHRYPVQLTTLEEDFRAIGLLPEKALMEADDSEDPRDIPSPDPSTLAGLDDSESAKTAGARSKYSRQPRPKMTPTETDDHDHPEAAGATQKGKSAGSYKPIAYGREKTEAKAEHYKVLKDVVMARAKDKGKDPSVAQGLKPTKSIAGMKKESANVSRAAELVSEVEALISGSQMSEEFNNLAHGFTLIAENASLLADRLVDMAEQYDVDHAITAMEDLYESAAEAYEIIEMKSKQDEDEDEDGEEALESIKEAFRLMTLQLMDAVESYDSTITEMSDDDKDDDDSDDDDSDDDDSDDDSDDDDSDDDKDDEKGGIAARMAKLRAAGGKKSPFAK